MMLTTRKYTRSNYHGMRADGGMHEAASTRHQGWMAHQLSGPEMAGVPQNKDRKDGAGQQEMEGYARHPYPSRTARWQEQNEAREQAQNSDTRHRAPTRQRYGEQGRGPRPQERSRDISQPKTSNDRGAQELRRVTWTQEGAAETKETDGHPERVVRLSRMAWQHRIRATEGFLRTSRHLEMEV